MSRQLKITLAILLLAVAGGAFYLRGLHERLLRLGRPEQTEKQARREVLNPPIATPTDTKARAKLFWASAATGALEPVEVELDLSGDAVHRAKQVLQALIERAPAPEQRTLPADAALLEFYLLEDGTAIADFSEALANATPSGILSEQRAVDSILRTLAANVEGVRRVKILIAGQEVETLAGHVDLTGMFALQAAPASPAAAEALTPPSAPGKLNH
jgi:hypothetical protein